jgi:hypothetical protein
VKDHVFYPYKQYKSILATAEQATTDTRSVSADDAPERHERQVEVVHAKVVLLVQKVVCRHDVQRYQHSGQGPNRVAAAADGQHGEGY